MSEYHHPNYVKVWAILCGLLAISVIGPMFEIPVLTMVTAFGIACVKAFLVLKNFMHLNVEKRLAVYILSTCLVFMFLLFAATAPDVMKQRSHPGDNWNWIKPLSEIASATPHTPPHGGGAH
jgi:caa(3)-type oxidase subunit IV